MKRIFYFTGHRMTVFHWSGKTLSDICSFDPGHDGFNKFRHYLESAAKTPVRLLVDVIEEDFMRESIPHVYGKDRRAVVGRLLDRYYRASRQYTYYEVLDRKKKGRRDDNVLLGAITNPLLIQPWLGMIDEADVPLCGIWTLPLVSRQLLSCLKGKKSSVLLVSQQVSSNLRQTFFKNGKMLSSRQSVINQDAEDISQIGTFARPEVDRTIGFLRNQHYLEPGEMIDVHILASDEQIASLKQAFSSDEKQTIHIHRIEDVHKKLGIKNVPARFADGLFTWLCRNHSSMAGHYGATEDFSRYYYTLASKAMYAASALIVIVALLMTEANITSAVESKRSVSLLNEQAQEYKQAYAKKFEAYEPVFMHAKVMNSAVDLAERMTINSKVTPLDFFIEISKVLSQPKIGTVHVDKIEWKAQQLADKGGRLEPVTPGPDITSKDRIRHVAVLKGRIPVPDNDYRGSVGKVNNIITALMQNERIEHVEAIDMPVEVRSEKRFSAESGAKTANDNNKEDRRGLFSLQIIMKAPDHV